METSLGICADLWPPNALDVLMEGQIARHEDLNVHYNILSVTADWSYLIVVLLFVELYTEFTCNVMFTICTFHLLYICKISIY